MHIFFGNTRISLPFLCALLAVAFAGLAASPRAEALAPEPGLAAAIVAPLEPERTTRRASGWRTRDADGDGLSDWFELRRARTNPRRRDTDRDRLSDWTEVKRTRTNPRRRDTDRDGISDWHELRRTKTNPRKTDSDGDGSSDRDELRAGSDPRDPASVPFPAVAAAPLFPAPLPAPTPTPGGGSEPTEPPPDTTPPAVQVTAGPDGLTNDASPTFGFNAEAGAALACSIDNGAADFGPCSGAGSHGSAEPLADGSHIFRVRATDAAGNEAVAMRGFIVDAADPATQIDATPPSLTGSASATFGFSGSDPGGSSVTSFECRIDSESAGAWQPCSSGIEFTGLAEGQHKFEVRAIDQAGNVDQSPASHMWTVDTMPPTVQITSGPDGLTNDDSPTFSFNPEAGATVQCSIDNGAADFGPCSGVGSHGSAEPLADGSHTFRVRATDAAGNEAVATRGFTVDATEPETQIDATPPSLTGSANAAFGFSGSDPGGSSVTSFECRIDSESAGAWQPCSSGIEFTGLAEGQHKFEVRAIDQAGNVDQSPASYEWTIDTTPPAVQVTSGPDGLTNDASPTFGFDAEAGATIECSIDNGTADFGPCSGAGSHTPAEPLADGAHTFRVRATDGAGNQAVATRGFEVDTALPPAPVLSATEPGSPANHNSPLVLGEAQAGTMVRLYVGGCSGAPVEIIGAGALEAGVEITVDDDSTTVFRATATTEAENTSGCSEPLTYVEDSTEPETTIDVGPPSLTNIPTAAFEFSGSDPDGSGVASFECRVDSTSPAAWSPCASGIELTELDEGQHKFEARAIDQAGNTEQSPAIHEWQVDLTAPQPQIDSLSKALLKASESSEVEWHADENGGFELRVGGTDCETGAVVESGAYDTQPAPRLSNVSAAQLAEGSNTLRLCLSDAAGNRGSATAAIVKDSIAPDTAIDAKPGTLTRETDAEIEFSGSDGSGSGVISFECRVDSAAPGAWAPCGSPTVLDDLDDGEHSFEVRAIDKAGNLDPTPASHTWTVDTTPPAIQVTSGPDGLTNNASPTFGFSAEAGATVQCSIDNGAADFGPCSGVGSHGSAEPLADGSHTFRVRATDAAGNQAVATREFDVDATEAETQIDAAPPSLTGSDSATFGFSGSDPGGSGVASFECRVDSTAPGAWAPCGSPKELDDLNDGEHGFEVRAIDNAGNVDPTPASYAWTVDTTPPAVQVTSGPDGLTNNASPTFGFDAEAGATVQCSIDEGTADFGPCSGAGSHGSAEPLADGSHIFRVRATDAAGNQAVATREFEIDTALPPAPLLSATEPGSPANHNSPLVLGEAQAGTMVRLYVGGCSGEPVETTGAGALEAGVEITVDNDSTTVFRATAMTEAENTSGCSEPLTYVEDSSEPETTIDVGPPSLTNIPTAVLEFSGADPGGSGVASFECRIDSEGAGAWQPCSSDIEFTGLVEGQHKFEVRAIDQAGNIDGSPASHTWTVDTTPPAVQATSGPDGLTNDDSPTFGFDAEAGATIECSIDNGTADFGPCSGAGSHGSAEPLADGTHTFRVRATDAAGNEAVAMRGFIVDATDPETQIDATPPSLTGSDSAAFGFSGSDPGGSGVTSFECRVDSAAPGAWAPCGSPRQLNGLSDGGHAFEVRAIDNAGNVDPTPASYAWTVDTTPPAVQVTSGPDGLTNNASPTFGFDAEAGATVQCSIDDGTPDFGPCSGTGSHGSAEPLADGSHTFRVRATDAAGNEAVATRGFEVDTALPPAPVLSATAPGSPANHNEPLVLGEAQAGTTVRLYAGGCSGEPIEIIGAGALEAGVEITVDDDSTTVFRATAMTEAENTSGCSEPLTYVEDSSEPETTIDVGPPPLTNIPTAIFEFSGADPGGSGVASFECRIDSTSPAAWAPCASGIELTELDEGQHEFEVRAIDQAGNIDQSPATHEWQVDLTAPQPQIDSLSKALLKAGESSEVEWHADENGAFELRVGGADCETGAVADSGAYDTQPAARISNVSATQLAEGANTLRLCLADPAGNRGSATQQIVKDSTAPQTQITLKPPAKTNNTTASFEFTGDDPGGSGLVSFECRLDGGAWTACASPQGYAGLSEGQHSFAVRALDNAGNRDQSPAEFEWQVDLTPPAVQVASGPDNLTSNPSPSFGFSAEAGAALACSIDTGAPDFGPCSQATSHAPATPLPDGAHVFRVRATDAAGNAATATRDFEVDATAPPSPQLDSTSPASPANQNEPLLLGSALPGATVRLYAGGTCSEPAIATFTAAELETGVTVPVPDDSTTVFRATATDAERTSGCSEPLTYVEDSSPPQTTISSSPPATTLSTSATFFPSSNEPGSSLECSLDGAPFEACASPASYAELALGAHSFSVRATDAAGNLDPTPAEWAWTIESPPAATSACDGGGVAATTPAAIRAAVQAGDDVCVTAVVGDVDLSALGARPVVVSTAPGGSIDDIDLASTTDLTISRARFRTTTLRNSHRTRLLENTIGGTPAERVLDQLIFMPTDNDDVAIEGNDLGWTIADNEGNSGYGCRCYGDLDRLRFVGNTLHDLAADGFQGVGGVDVTIDRNEIGPVGRNPGSNEHTDNIQITGNEANLRITNNWIHHQGYYEGEVTANAGSTYIHGGSDGSLLFANNLIETAQGRTEICGLGTGGSERSNLTVRRNTWVDGGIAFNGFPGFEWDCDAGANNTITRNIAVDPDGGLADNGYDAALVEPNLFGTPDIVTLDAAGNCTSANCNPEGEEPIGYRKPAGVSW